MGKDWAVRIIVVGAGEVGSYVAERLSRQGHHVVLIESDTERFRQGDQDLDVMTLRGSGTDPVTLAAAGIEQAGKLHTAITSRALRIKLRQRVHRFRPGLDKLAIVLA